MSSGARNTLQVRPAQPMLPPWVPRRPPKTWTVTEVVRHAKTAMIIELTTIPLYLYAAYSIDITSSDLDQGTLAAGQDARLKIIHIVVQEMLHLALSGNLVCALGGYMDLYDFRVIPQFPGTILYEQVEMDLNCANQENLTDFKKIEEPVHLDLLRFNLAAARAKNVLPDYLSIGMFYENLKQGLSTLSDDHLKHNPGYQFSPNDFNRLGGMVVITDQEIAQTALELIIEQGEGGPDVQDSHYSIFSQLSADPPAWSLYDVPENPKTRDYKDVNDFAYKLSLAFDAGYCYLLQTIQRVWGRGGNEVYLHNHLVGIMLALMKSVMPELALILVGQALGEDDDSEVAAPCFNYYPLHENGKPHPPLEPDDLYSELLRLINEAIAIAPTDADVEKLKTIADAIEQLTPWP